MTANIGQESCSHLVRLIGECAASLKALENL